MSDDLIKRLRWWGTERCGQPDGTLCDEAAAELERLLYERDALQAENLKLREACASGWGEPALINTLQAELAEARKDAERYRWLRDGPACIVDMVSDPDNLVQIWHVTAPGVEQTSVGLTLDAAIDAAIREQK